MKFFTGKDFLRFNDRVIPGERDSLDCIAEIANAKLDAEFGTEYAIVCHFRESNENLRAELKAARSALAECKGMLSAHEYAIRNDHGNSNFEICQAKVTEAIKCIDDGLEEK